MCEGRAGRDNYSRPAKGLAALGSALPVLRVVHLVHQLAAQRDGGEVAGIDDGRRRVLRRFGLVDDFHLS